jgi:hypothetical protein
MMILRAMPAVALLLVGPPLPERSKVMTQTKTDTPVLQSRGLGVGQTSSQKNLIVQKPCNGCRTDLERRPCKRNRNKDMLATWNVRETVENEGIG